jgi:hypothetical protein
MNRPSFIALLTIGLAAAAAAQASQTAVDNLLRAYRSGDATEFAADRGAELWRRQTPGSDGTERACTSCHGDDLRQPGRHASTGKIIEPMAPSVRADRLGDPAKIEKWFKRNCTWTWGRECTSQEKGDFLAYLRGL